MSLSSSRYSPRAPIILTLAFILAIFLSSSAAAVFDDSTGVIWVTQGAPIQLGEHTVRVIDASINEGVPFLEIKKRGTQLYKGFIEIDKPVEIPNEVLVEYLGSSERVMYGPQVKIRVSQWVDGRIITARFPRYMNTNTRYDVWLDIQNTGTKDAMFRTVLTQEGRFDTSSGRYILPDGRTSPILLDMQFPHKNVRVGSSESTRVEYNSLAPNGRQQSLQGDNQVRAGNYLEKNGNIIYQLFYKDQLLDQAVIPDVTYGNSQSGYIKDIDMPDIMIANTPYESNAYITNGGTGGNNIDTGKLNLQLNTKGFTIGQSTNKAKTTELQISEDLLRKNLLSGVTDRWKFTITPHVPAGEYILEFRLWQNRHDYLYSTYDIFTKRVRVLENPIKLIAGFVVPPSVTVGSRIPIDVTLNNAGEAKLVNVNIRAPSLLDGPVKRILTLPIDASVSFSYDIPAQVEGPADITVEVYPHMATNSKWNDPYAEAGYLIDSVTKTIHVAGLEEGPGYAPLPESELPPQPKKPGPTGTTPAAQPDTTATGTAGKPSVGPETRPLFQGQPQGQPAAPETAPSWQPRGQQPATGAAAAAITSTPGITFLTVLFAVIILFAARVGWKHYKRGQRAQIREEVVKHMKKR